MMQASIAASSGPRATRPRHALCRMLVLLAGGACALGAAADCTVTATGLAFGSYDPFSGQPLNGAGSISVSCIPATAYSIALSAGNGSYAQRRMLSGSDTLGYNLFTDATRTMVWGDGSAGTTTVAGNAESALHTVYGRVSARQNVSAGGYSDSLIVTLTF